MKTETRMDCLMQRLYDFNDLTDMRQDPIVDEAADTDAKEKKKRGGKSGGGQDGFFSAAVGEILFRRNSTKRPGILGIIHPSDGHPQEELSPDFGWFRPLSFNNATWTLYWPDLII